MKKILVYYLNDTSVLEHFGFKVIRNSSIYYERELNDDVKIIACDNVIVKKVKIIGEYGNIYFAPKFITNEDTEIIDLFNSFIIDEKSIFNKIIEVDNILTDDGKVIFYSKQAFYSNELRNKALRKSVDMRLNYYYIHQFVIKDFIKCFNINLTDNIEITTENERNYVSLAKEIKRSEYIVKIRLLNFDEYSELPILQDMSLDRYIFRESEVLQDFNFDSASTYYLTKSRFIDLLILH